MGLTQQLTPRSGGCCGGPSGSGKSTFLRCLNLLEKPTAGEIYFDGQLITAPGVNVNEIRREMGGMVFQSFNLFPHLTVLDNIALAPKIVRHVSKDEAEETARDLLRKVGGSPTRSLPIRRSCQADSSSAWLLPAPLL